MTLSACVPTVLVTHSTGISTCCPSTTHFCLALGPDLPREDELYPGTLGRSVGGILTLLTLLTPAFSLLSAPIVLSIYLLRTKNAPLPLILTYESVASVVCLSPGTFSAQNHSTSELLRTL